MALVGLLALLLRLIRLDDPLWLDEAAAVLIAWEGPTGAVDALARDSTPPLYYWLLWAWTSLVGSTETLVRIPSAVGGVLAVVATMALARRLAGPRAALIASLMVALSPLAIYYSREARMYAFTPLIAAWALLTLERALTTGERRWFGYHALALVVGLYTHNFFVFFLAAAPVAALVVRRDRLVLAIGAPLLALVGFIPWLPILVEQAGSGVTAWIPKVWADTPPSLALWRSLEAMTPGGVYPAYLRGLGQLAVGTPIRVVATAVVLGLAAVGARSMPRIPRTTALVGLVVPLFLPWIASFVVMPVYVVGRYELVALPALACLVGAGAVAIPLRVALVASASYVAAAGLVVTLWLNQPVNTFERDAAQAALKLAGEGDVVIFCDYTRAVGEYTFRVAESGATVRSWPAAIDAHPGWYDHQLAWESGPELRAEAMALAAELRPLVAAGNRVFIVDHTRMQPVASINRLLHVTLRQQLGRERVGWIPKPAHPPVVTVFGGPATTD